VPTPPEPPHTGDRTTGHLLSTRRLSRSGRRVSVAATLAALASVAALVHVGLFDRTPLLDPAIADIVEVLAVLALVGSWVSRRRSWLTRVLPAVVLAAAIATGIIAATLRVTGLVADAYPASFTLWVGIGLAAVISAPVVISRAGMLRRLGAAAAVPLALLGALLLVNDEYGAWPTLGDLLRHSNMLDSSALHLPPDAVETGTGALVAADPPAARSHFVHRPGSVYLPPAYFTPARAKLPVIIMLAGAPGGTIQWPTAGNAIATADAFAATHGGRAPVLLFVDQNGSAIGDTECVDGPQGNAETYLTVDVPAFVTRTLRVQRSAERWAIVGFSEGGTCAVDLALAHPLTFRHFVDLAGDAGPNLGDAEQTRSALFGGSATAMRNHDPKHLLAKLRYRDMTAWFAAGVNDPGRLAVAQGLAAAATRAGLKVHRFTGVGAHNWQFASDAFSRVLPDLCTDLGLR
jgi:S-formylglutathione hydrolase FrmB